MKSILIFLTLISFTLVATSATISVAEVEDAFEDSSVGEDSLKSAATHFLGTLDNSSSASSSVEKLLSGMVEGESMDAVSALKSLAKMDFSKEQLTAYGSMLAQAIPPLLEQNFDLENGEMGKYIGKAMGFFESENFASAADAVSKALESGDINSLQEDLLNGIVSSYAPMLKGMDLNQAVNIGKSLMGKKETKLP